MTARRWSVVHLTLTCALIVWSGLANSPVVFDQGVGVISDRLRNAFTPASWAFAIWGPIYAGLLAMNLVGLWHAFRAGRDARWVEELGGAFALAQIACASWLAAWLAGQVGLSLIIMTVLLASLFACVVRLDMEKWDAPWMIIVPVWWPISLYFGWITAAWLANLSAWLVSRGSNLPQTPEWAIGLAIVLTVAHLSLIFSRNMREAALVAVWALVAVGARHWDAPTQSSVVLATSACAVLLLVAVATHAARNFTWPPEYDPSHL